MKVSFKKILQHSIYLNKIINKLSPALFVTVLLSAIADSSLTFLNLIFTRYLVQKIQDGIEFSNILLLLSIWGIIFLLLKGVISLSENYFTPVYSKILVKRLDLMLYDKVKMLDLECYDDPKFYNDYIWTTHNAGQIFLDGSKSVGVFLKYILQIAGVVSVIFMIDPSMAALTIISVVITLLVNARRQRNNWLHQKESIEGEKKRRYIERMFYLQDSAKDIRLTNIKDRFIEIYDDAYEELDFITGKYAMKSLLLLFTSTYIFRYLLNTFVIYLFFAYKLLLTKTIILSDFVAVNMGMVSLYLSLTRWSDQINNLYKNVLYIESMKVFLEYEPRIEVRDQGLAIPEGELEIKFINVCYQYPGEEEASLKDINLTIHPNKMLAIVGYNGAGKTTLIKLLLRLYDVSSGEILLNGINIKEYNVHEYRQCFGVVFQDFQMFACSVGENIALDDVKEENEQQILEAIDFADFRDKYKGFHRGLSTPMTREFEEDGVLLSGGELQKIALARVMAKDSRIVILDEPSSALDPISEYKINRQMEEISDSKTIILISHRLTTTKMADHIIMLAEGEIVEQGTHDSLMEAKREYEKIYRVQAEQYLGKTV